MDKVVHRSPLPLLGLLPVSVVVFIALCGSVLGAQEIRIKVLNGRNGRPVTNECVNVWLGDLSVGSGRSPAAELLIPTDKDGLATLRLTRGAAHGVSYRRTTACNGGGQVDPTVGYAATIGVSGDYYVACQAHPPDSPMLPFSVEKILESGDVSANFCGKIEASPKPGELILFVRPMHWWERAFH